MDRWRAGLFLAPEWWEWVAVSAEEDEGGLAPAGVQLGGGIRLVSGIEAGKNERGFSRGVRSGLKSTTMEGIEADVWVNFLGDDGGSTGGLL